MKRRRHSVTYREVGVDIRGAGQFIRAIAALARLTRRPGLLKGIGGFGGLFEIGRRAGKDSILVASADGVGTKGKLAQRACLRRWHGRQVGWYAPLGIDLVAMNVNDILCAGAEPLFFLDYIAAGRLNPNLLLEIVRGVVRGCVESRCVLLGGETAQMPLVYRRGEFDLAGFAVGLVRRRDWITGQKIRPGHRLLGLASNGVHSNGFTLVQKVLSVAEQKRLSRELLKPTRIYVRPVLDLLRAGAPVSGIAHITGGSFGEKLARILLPGTSARLTKGSWPVPPIFQKIQSAGVAEAQMYRTFNMGIGMILSLPRAAVKPAQRRLIRQGFASWDVGEITRGQRRVTTE